MENKFRFPVLFSWLLIIFSCSYGAGFSQSGYSDDYSTYVDDYYVTDESTDYYYGSDSSTPAVTYDEQSTAYGPSPDSTPSGTDYNQSPEYISGTSEIQLQGQSAPAETEETVAGKNQKQTTSRIEENSSEPAGDRLLREGMESLNTKDYKTAREKFKAAIVTDPRNDVYWLAYDMVVATEAREEATPVINDRSEPSGSDSQELASSPSELDRIHSSRTGQMSAGTQAVQQETAESGLPTGREQQEIKTGGINNTGRNRNIPTIVDYEVAMIKPSGPKIPSGSGADTGSRNTPEIRNFYTTLKDGRPDGNMSFIFNEHCTFVKGDKGDCFLQCAKKKKGSIIASFRLERFPKNAILIIRHALESDNLFEKVPFHLSINEKPITDSLTHMTRAFKDMQWDVTSDLKIGTNVIQINIENAKSVYRLQRLEIFVTY